MSENIERDSTVLGQKYAFATVSLVLGVFCFINLLGLEKPILAIIFGYLALRSNPGPILKEHRAWAKIGVTLGAIMLILVPLIIIFNFDRLREIFELLTKINGSR